ncbi:MAG: cyclase family protein [Pirellula sp.]
MTIKRKGLLVGAGYFSGFHLDAWRRMPNAEIVCVVDLDECKAREASNRHNIPVFATNIDQALERHDLDFVDIATTPHGRLDLIKQVLKRKLPIICQKPLANSFSESIAIMDLAQANECPFMVHENFRFQPWYREIKRILESGVVGRRLHTIHMRTRTGDGWGEDAYLGRQPYFRQMPRLLIHETGVHFVDTFRYLAGEIVECFADVRRLNHCIQGEDAGVLQFVFENGARGMWDANRYNEPQILKMFVSTSKGMPNSFNPRYTFGELLVEADGGSIWLDADGTLTIKQLGKEPIQHEYCHSREGFGGDCVYATQQHFMQVLDGTVACETSCDEYRKTLRVVESLYESAVLRKPMSLGLQRQQNRIVDLSLSVSADMRGVQISPCRTIAQDGWNATTLNLYSHAGTHMDAPYHFVPGGQTLDQQVLSACCGRARIVNLAPAPPRMHIIVSDVIQSIGYVDPGDRLLFRTDWYLRYGTTEYRDELPRISLELAHWLVECKVALIGVEPPSVADVNNMVELTEVHQALFRGGIVIVEGLANLDQLSQSVVEFIALPLKILGGDGCPVRAIAIEGSNAW